MRDWLYLLPQISFVDSSGSSCFSVITIISKITSTPQDRERILFIWDTRECRSFGQLFVYVSERRGNP